MAGHHRTKAEKVNNFEQSRVAVQQTVIGKDMCGIVGAVAQRSVAPILIQGLQRLEYRGYDSAGVAVIDDLAQIQRRREVGKVANLSNNLAASPVMGSVGIAHTRWATHGAVEEQNTHPHMSGDELAVVHNGIIENYLTLREELTAAGYVFASDTDSEVVAHLVHSCLGEKGLLDAVRQAVKRLEGAYAIALCWKNQPNRIVATRSGCPLVVGKGIGENYLASDVLALKAVTDRFIFLEEPISGLALSTCARRAHKYVDRSFACRASAKSKRKGNSTFWVSAWCDERDRRPPGPECLYSGKHVVRYGADLQCGNVGLLQGKRTWTCGCRHGRYAESVSPVKGRRRQSER